MLKLKIISNRYIVNNLFRLEVFVVVRNIVFLFLITLNSCSGPRPVAYIEKKTCVVLSVGGMKGLAHIGAIDAIKEKGINIDCIYGNSMGSVIGGIYAQAPERDLKDNVKSVIKSYITETEEEYKSKATSGFLFGAGLAFLTGGLFGWETILGSALLNMLSVDNFDNNRFRQVLDNHFSSVSIESLLIPYATSYHERKNNSIKLKTISTGNLAMAISRSSNNPFIFKETSLDYIDPGLDRFSAVPVEDAIKHFDPDIIIAINVTDEPAKYQNYEDCKIIEIEIDVGEIEISDITRIDQILDEYYTIGYNKVNEEL